MDVTQNLESIELYKNLLQQVGDLTFELKATYPEQIFCKEKCCDCCKNIFNISVIEGYYLEIGFVKLVESQKESLIKNLLKLNVHLENEKEKIKEMDCPCLVDQICVLYDYRPLICRTFGYPMLDEKTTNIATCSKNFPMMREEEYTLKTISTKKLSAQTVLLSQYLLRELGKQIPENHVPPLYSIIEILLPQARDFIFD